MQSKKRQKASLCYNNGDSETNKQTENHPDLFIQNDFGLGVKIYGNVKDFVDTHKIFYFEVEVLSRGSVAFGFKDGKPSAESVFEGNNWDSSGKATASADSPRLTSIIYGVGVIKSPKKYFFFQSKNGHIIERRAHKSLEELGELRPFVHIMAYGGIVYVNMGDKPSILDFRNNLPTISPNRMSPYGRHAPMVSFDGRFCSFHDEINLSVSIGRYSIDIHFPNNSVDDTFLGEGQTEQEQSTKAMEVLNRWQARLNRFLQIGRYVGYEFSIELCKVSSSAEIVFGFTSELPTNNQDSSEVIDDIRRLFCVSLSNKGMVLCRKINRAYKITRPDAATQWEYEKRLGHGLRLFASISTNLDGVTFWFQTPNNAVSRTLRIETRPTDWHMETMYPFVSVVGNGVLCHVSFDDIQDSSKSSAACVTEEVLMPGDASIGSNLHLNHFLSRDHFLTKSTKK